MIRAALLTVALAGCAVAPNEPSDGTAQLAASVQRDLTVLGFDVDADALTQRQLVQLTFALDGPMRVGTRDWLDRRRTVETILRSPDGAGRWF